LLKVSAAAKRNPQSVELVSFERLDHIDWSLTVNKNRKARTSIGDISTHGHVLSTQVLAAVIGGRRVSHDTGTLNSEGMPDTNNTDG
jgi:hypothetical protein